MAGTLDAFVAVGLLSEEERRTWESRFNAPESGSGRASMDQQSRANAVREDLLAAIPTDAEEEYVELNRFEGAVHALTQVGVSVGDWDARLRERLGWPTEEEEHAQMRELNAGGTEQELREVLAGPPEPTADGVRLLFALRFADGIIFVIRREPPADHSWPFDASLHDDVGTDYHHGRGGGGNGDLRLSFRTAPPARASSVELSRISAEPIRVVL
jgi:hypothetical protein